MAKSHGKNELGELCNTLCTFPLKLNFVGCINSVLLNIKALCHWMEVLRQEWICLNCFNFVYTKLKGKEEAEKGVLFVVVVCLF